MGMLWKDPVGSFIWGGLVSRLASERLLPYYLPASTVDPYIDSLALHLLGQLVSVTRSSLGETSCRCSSLWRMFRLAHWDGLQPYSDENTSRGNLVSSLPEAVYLAIPMCRPDLALLDSGTVDWR